LHQRDEMDKPAEYERIISLLERGERPSQDDWNWINKYLELADKANGITTPIPFRPRKILE